MTSLPRPRIRPAYFPRTPPEKSYSARISVDSGSLRFVILPPLGVRRRPSADDADIVASQDVRDNHHPRRRGHADEDEPLFADGMFRVGCAHREQIIERRGGLAK